MEIFSLRPRCGQTLVIDSQRFDGKMDRIFQDGPIEILFCRLAGEQIALSIKAPNNLNIFLSDVTTPFSGS